MLGCPSGFGMPGPPLVPAAAGVIAAADLDGDGRTDLVVGSRDSQDFPPRMGCLVLSLLRTGRFTFADPTPTSTGLTIIDSIAVVDFDGDRLPDAVVHDGQQPALRFLRNTGKGTFAPPVTIDLPAPPRGLIAADLDGDGRLDLVTALRTSKPAQPLFQVLLGNGDGTFYEPVARAPTGDGAALASADLDGDGLPDLAVALRSASVISIVHNLGGGAFAEITRVALPGAADRVTFGDWNGDGAPDLAAAAGRQIAVFLNRGPFRYAPDPARALIDGSVASLAAIDLDRDGRDELLVADDARALSGDQFAVFELGDAGQLAPGPRPVVAGPATSVVALDLDGDAAPDLVVAHAGDGEGRPIDFVSLILNTERRGLTVPLRTPTPFPLHAFDAGDLDGDGAPDIVVDGGGYAYGAPLAISTGRNEGNGHFQFSVPAAMKWHHTVLRLGDLDGDGRPDLAGADPGRADVPVQTWLNVGGSLGPPIDSPAPGFLFAADLVDLTGDGLLDLFLNRHMMINLGHGRFGGVVNVPGLSTESDLGRLIEDFNSDGVPDILYCTDYGVASVYLSDIRGRLAPPIENKLPVGLCNGDEFAVDWTGDGSADLMLAGDRDYMLVNRGDGTFEPATEVTVPGGTFEIPSISADFDADGRPDLVMWRPFGSPMLAVRRGVPGGFAATQFFPTGQSSGLLLRDFDGDGRDDAVVYAPKQEVLMLPARCLPGP